jgi:hypothetical protein
MPTKKDDGADMAAQRMLAALEKDGVAVSSVSDGHVLLFKRSKLQDILAKTVGKELLTIFVKTKDLN